jgi:putative ABC transport system permease protein
MTPILNSMTVAGVVNIPGVMTGQLIAGVSPNQAVQSQLAILMLVSVLVFAGVSFFHHQIKKRVFTEWQQLNSRIWIT